MDKVSLVLPCEELRESYMDNLREFLTEDPKRPVQWKWFTSHFQEYLEMCRDQREQVGIVNDRPPQTVFWIVWNDREVVGKFEFRHGITPKLEKLGGYIGYEIRPSMRRKGIATEAVRLALQQYARRGIERIFTTCDDDNVGSIGVLEKSGGILIEKYPVEGWLKLIRKYDLKTKL